MSLLGTDRLGRDQWSRLMFGTRTSLTIGMIAVLFSTVLGVLLGGISGYFGGVVDTIIQRLIELLQSLPTIPIWLALTAALPQDWRPEQVFFAITIILSLIGWTTLAREVRGRFLALREEDFVLAAELAGLQPHAHHHAPHGADVHEPHHRDGHTRDPGDDRQRDLAEFSGAGSAPARDQLGRAAARSAEYSVDCAGAMVAALPAWSSLSPCWLSTWSATACATRRIRTVTRCPSLRALSRSNLIVTKKIASSHALSALCVGAAPGENAPRNDAVMEKIDRMTDQTPLLSVRNLKAYFDLDEGIVKAVDGVTFDVYPGQVFGIVGESGCGKSVTMKAILRIIEPPGKIVGGEIVLHRPVEHRATARSPKRTLI